MSEKVQPTTGNDPSPVVAGRALSKKSSSISMEDIRKRTSRGTVMHHISKMKKNSQGEVEADSIVNLIESHVDEQKRQAFMRKIYFLVGIVLLSIVALNSGTTFMLIMATKDSKTDNDGELTTMSGVPVATKNSDIETDSSGSLVQPGAEDGADNLVRVGTVEAYTSLVELPKQKTDFINSIEDVSVVVDGTVKKYDVQGYDWVDTTHMTLFTSRVVMGLEGGICQHKIIIDGSLVYVDQCDGTKGQIEIHNCNSERRERRGLSSDACAVPEGFGSRRLDHVLANHGKKARTYTWSELVARYAEETGRDADIEHRRLAAGGSSLYDLYAWLGGSVKSQAQAGETPDCEATADAHSVTKGAPTPEVPTTSKWIAFQPASEEGGIDNDMVFYMDLSDVVNPKFHIMSHSIGDQLTHEVTVDGQTYHYLVTKLDQALLDAAVTEAEQNWWTYVSTKKTACEVVESEADFENAYENARSAFVMEARIDGSALWNVAGWQIEIAADGSVLSIGGIEVTSIEEYTPSDDITIGQMPLFATCDPDADPDADDKRWLEPMLEQEEGVHLPTEDGEARRLTAAHPETGRQVSAWTSFQAWASGTAWCGAGSDLDNTPCPGTTGGDTEADFACHRHDHGNKANGIIGGYAVRLGCDIDRGLADRTSNTAAQLVFGSWGLAQTWGCYDHGSYNCWNWASKWWGGYWRYGGYCYGEHTHYGPWRYSSYSHSYGWKSQTRCSTDLPWCTGCI